MHIVHLIIQIVPLNVLAFLATLVIRKLEIYASMALPIAVLEELLEVHVCVEEHIQVLLLLILICVGNECSSENLIFITLKTKPSHQRGLCVIYILPWQCLYFLPLPQGHKSLRATLPQVLGSLGLNSAREYWKVSTLCSCS